MGKNSFIKIAMVLFVFSFSSSQKSPDKFEQLADFYAAQEKKMPEEFVHLSTLKVEDDITTSIKEGIWIHYLDAVSEVISQKLKEKKGFIKTKIDKEKDIYYTVDFLPGPSIDPCFIIYKNEGDKLVAIGTEKGTEVFIPGDGYLYVAGHTNSMFNERRKFCVENSSICEVQQPFYYVGLESETTEDIVLYSDTSLKKEVAIIPAASHVTVLINSQDYYLIKTSFGLTGWIHIPHGYYSPIKYIFFRGD